jgi:hypothetical protein
MRGAFAMSRGRAWSRMSEKGMTFREWISKGTCGPDIVTVMGKHCWRGANALELPVQEIQPTLTDILVVRDIIKVPEDSEDYIVSPIHVVMRVYFEVFARWIDETFGPLTDDMTVVVWEGRQRWVHRREAAAAVADDEGITLTPDTPEHFMVEICLNIADANGNKANGIPFSPKSLMVEGNA